MAEAFDAYYVWLGIGPEEQPANHYRLLGIRVFEPNLEVIESAADRQMAHLRTFQQGKNARLSQRLLNEVSAARVCLLNPATKTAYDAQLRAAARPLPRAMPANLPVAPSLGSPTAPAPAQPGTNWDALIGDGDRSPVKKLSSRTKSRIAQRTSNNRLVYLLTAAGLLLAGGVAVIVYINGMSAEPEQRTVEHVRPAETSSDKNVADAGSQRKILPTDAPHDAVLAIVWPVAEREGGSLTIDGKDQPLDAVKLEFPIAPGRHSLVMSRDGFEPIRQIVAVGSQPLRPIMPAWVRRAAVASTVEPTPTTVKPVPADAGDDAAATPSVKPKLPVPSAADQERVGKQLDQTYKVEHVAEKDHALAVELFDVADGPGNSPEERYTLLVKGAGLAASAGDFELAFRRGIDPLSADYEIDPFEMKQKLLDDSLKSASNPEKIVAIVVTTEQLIDAALADERYDTALELVAMAKKVLSSAHAEPRFRKEATDRLAGRLRDIPALQKASAVAIEAETTLEKSPDDPAANLALGRWYCLYKRDWDRGLPLLVKGPDGPLKSLAEQELAVNLQLKPQLDLADGWWEVGQKESGPPRDAARLHAGEIYRLQLPSLQPGLKKTAVEQRVKELDAIQSLAPLPTGAVLLLTFDKLTFFKRNGVQYVRDLSGHGNHGLVHGAQLTAGQAGTALSFSPNGDYVECLNSDSLNLTQAVTVSAWIRVRSWRQRTYIVSKDDWNDGHSHGFVLRGDENAAGGIDFTVGSDDWHYGRSHGKLELGQWNHIAAAYDGKTTDVYIDGRMSGSSPAPGPISPSSYPLRIGRGAFAPDRDFDGDIDEVAVFPRALSENEAQSLYAIGQKGQSLATTENRIAAPRESPTKTTSSGVPRAAAPAFPRNRWGDLLRLVDIEHDAINGDWSRSGDAVLSDAKRYCRIKLPVSINGGYDLEVDFTRREGTNDVNTIIPVGSRRCMIMLSGSDGKASGVDRIDGHSITDNRNLAAIHPGSIENGHRYRLDISVRLVANETASIDVSLDGKPYLPRWEGKLASLDIAPRWALPNAQQPGLGAWKSRVTFHAVRLRTLSGDAISESTVAQPLNLPTVISARWGGGNNWSRVTEKVQEAVDRREAVHASPGFLGADPTPGWRKHLEITFEKEGQQQKVSIDEGQQWMLRDYAGEGTK